MNIPELISIIIVIFIILFITILVIKRLPIYKENAKKEETNRISKKIVYSFTKQEDCNLTEMITYYKENGCPKYEV
ncbi:MAG: hypothetical protein E7311_00115 [Clostridiales bacterium]|nr:hypothetical protein [Clostridiales bacterium]